MTKTNFTKVEEALEQGLRKMNVEQLFEISGDAKSKQSQNPGIAYSAEEGKKAEETPLSKAQTRLIAALQRDLKRLQIREHREMYNQLGMKKSELKKKIAVPSKLTPEEWEQIKQIKEKIDDYKQSVQMQLARAGDDMIVSEQRQKHINKRFNVNDNWLPLH